MYIYIYISSSIRCSLWVQPHPCGTRSLLLCQAYEPHYIRAQGWTWREDFSFQMGWTVEPSWTLKNIQKSYRKKAGRRSNHLNNFKSCQAQEWVKGCLQRASVGARPFIFFNPATNSLGLTEPLLSDSCAQLSNWKEKPSAKGWRVVQPCVPSTSISSKRSSISSKPQINGLV